MLEEASGCTCRKVWGVEDPGRSQESCLGPFRSLLGHLDPGCRLGSDNPSPAGTEHWELGPAGVHVPRLHGHTWAWVEALGFW